jgi:hypothetical protein
MTASLLERYNEARKRQGLPIFTKWTGTTESLQDAYNKLTGGNGKDHDPPTRKTKVKAKVKVPENIDPAPVKRDLRAPKDKQPGPERSKAMKEHSTRIVSKAEKLDKNKAIVEKKLTTITLAEVCAKLNVVPKTARVQLRAAYGEDTKGKLPKRQGGTWVFDPKDVKAIEEIIKTRPATKPKRAA